MSHTLHSLLKALGDSYLNSRGINPSNLPANVSLSLRLDIEAGSWLAAEGTIGILYDQNGYSGYYTTASVIGEASPILFGIDAVVQIGLLVGPPASISGYSFEEEFAGVISNSISRPLDSLPIEYIEDDALRFDQLDLNDTQAIADFVDALPEGYLFHTGLGSDIAAGAEVGYTQFVPVGQSPSSEWSFPALISEVWNRLIQAAKPQMQEGGVSPWSWLQSNAEILWTEYGPLPVNALANSLSDLAGLVPDALVGTAFEHFLPSTLLGANGGLDVDWDWSTIDLSNVTLAASLDTSGYSFNYITVPGITVTSTAGDWKGTFAQTSDGVPIRHQAKRRRLRTVIQELMYVAARVVESGRRLALKFSSFCPAFPSFEAVYGRLAAT